MLTFDQGNNRFDHRVAGACVHKGHVLLTHAECEDFWLLPEAASSSPKTRRPRSTARYGRSWAAKQR